MQNSAKDEQVSTVVSVLERIQTQLGIAGRTGPGVCFRLYSEEEYEAMERYTTPELLRVPLDSLLLQMVAMGLPDARQFPFIEAPDADSIETSIRTLKEQVKLVIRYLLHDLPYLCHLLTRTTPPFAQCWLQIY